MLRTLRQTRSLPSLRTTALSHSVPPIPTRSITTKSDERGRTSGSTTTKRSSSTDNSAQARTIMTKSEPKKRGRPRKESRAVSTEIHVPTTMPPPMPKTPVKVTRRRKKIEPVETKTEKTAKTGRKETSQESQSKSQVALNLRRWRDRYSSNERR